MKTNRCSKFLFPACLISVSLSAWAQQTTLPEAELGTGFEPVVNADRVTTDPTSQRVQFAWMISGATYEIKRRITHDLGANWQDPISFAGAFKTRGDPITACNVGGSAAPRHMYFGWYSEVGSATGAHFFRSIRGDDYDNDVFAQSGGTDRPWLVANSASLYLSYNGLNLPYVKRAAIPPGEQTITWNTFPTYLVDVAERRGRDSRHCRKFNFSYDGAGYR